MERRIIPVAVRERIATAPKDALYVCGNSDYVIRFDFDDEWAAHNTKTARFVYNGTHEDKIFDGNECPVPVISNTYSFDVGVFAGNLRTTTAAYIPCKKSILCKSGSPSAPPPDVYAQIMEKLNSIEGGDVSPEAIAAAVEAYMKEHSTDDVIELIETITLEEDMAITRSEESDGTPYGFRELRIKATATAESAASGSLFAYCGNTAIGKTWWSAWQNGTGERYRTDIFQSVSGYWGSEWVDWSANISGQVTVNRKDMYLMHSAAAHPSITRFSTAFQVPAGTTLEIWGVRA